MKKTFNLKNPLLFGAATLTIAGGISRIMGFFYRIFLSRTIGAEGLGLYQLITPVIAIVFALSCAGFQTTISKYVASCPENKNSYLFCGCLISVLTATALAVITYKYSLFIAINILGDYRCSYLLKIASYSFIPSAIHCCINGYFYGIKKTTIPAISQLVEQVVRIGSVYIFVRVLDSLGQTITPAHGIWGIVLSEIAGMIFVILFFDKIHIRFSADIIKKILQMAIPLCANYLLLNICMSVENILIPRQLNLFGYSSADALSIYGVLNGIAMPVLLFPGVFFNSVCVMLLPEVSEAVARNERTKIERTINLTIYSGTFIGVFCIGCFWFSADYIGINIFASAMAGSFIKRLCWLSPFMYLSSMLGSILHGLGQPKNVLLANLLSSGIRIASILVLVPQYGINAYLWGLLIAHIFTTIIFLILSKSYEQKFQFN